MDGENNSFFFFFFNPIVHEIALLLTFFAFVGKEIKLKGTIFQNLYEYILVRQKLKMKQGNPPINIIDDF